MSAFRFALWAAVGLGAACTLRRIEPIPAAKPQAAQAAPAERAAPVDPDADGDGIANPADGCPIEAGEAASDGCPAAYGRFFLRVLDAETRSPVAAVLLFSPVVSRVIAEDDGYAGTLAPGAYRVAAVAPGYAPGELSFEVGPQERPVLVLTLKRGASGAVRAE